MLGSGLGLRTTAIEGSYKVPKRVLLNSNWINAIEESLMVPQKTAFNGCFFKDNDLIFYIMCTSAKRIGCILGMDSCTGIISADICFKIK